MRKLLLVIFSFSFLFSNSQQNSPNWVLKLAKQVNLELVYGDKFPYESPYGSYGSPFISDVLYTGKRSFDKTHNIFRDESFNYILFYGRKKKDKYYGKDKFFHYDYYLVFARTQVYEYGVNYKIEKVFKAPGGLLGMHLHYGKLDKDLSEFSYLQNFCRKGPKGIRADEVNTPVIFPSDNGIIILVYYKGDWLILKK